MGKGHRPPLTAAELAAIYDANPTPVVIRLMWEIHRLRSTVLRANQVRSFMGPNGTHRVPQQVWECFVRDLDAEPCLTDPPTPRQRGLLYAGETEGRRKRRMRNGS